MVKCGACDGVNQIAIANLHLSQGVRDTLDWAMICFKTVRAIVLIYTSVLNCHLAEYI